MTIPATAARSSAWPEMIDVCDRCLALSQLTVALAKVPQFRVPEPAPQDEPPEASGAGSAPPPRPYLDPDTLAPTPGALVRAVEGVSSERAATIANDHRGWHADAVRAAAFDAGLHAMCRCAAGYPATLHHLTDSPPVIYVRGDRWLLERCPDEAVSMVGTRHPTATGRAAARRIAGGVARSGGVVVSGMAMGIDAASHEGALHGGGPTVAVLATGADLPTPSRNRDLYARILDRGAVVSELPPGIRPFLWSFPARNRIIAALGIVTVVVEAPVKSGALITVEQATDLGRDTYAVPGSLASDVSEGTNLMLQDGSGAVIDGAHLAGVLKFAGAGDARSVGPQAGPAATVHALLSSAPLTGAEIERRAGAALEAGELELVLLDLELAGWVERRPDGRYRVIDRFNP